MGSFELILFSWILALLFQHFFNFFTCIDIDVVHFDAQLFTDLLSRHKLAFDSQSTISDFLAAIVAYLFTPLSHLSIIRSNLLFLQIAEQFKSSGVKSQFSNLLLEALVYAFADKLYFFWEGSLGLLPSFLKAGYFEVNHVADDGGFNVFKFDLFLKVFGLCDESDILDKVNFRILYILAHLFSVLSLSAHTSQVNLWHFFWLFTWGLFILVFFLILFRVVRVFRAIMIAMTVTVVAALVFILL